MPSNLKLTNRNKNEFGKPNFFQFYFNFTNNISINTGNSDTEYNSENNQNNKKIKKLFIKFLMIVVITHRLFLLQILSMATKIIMNLIEFLIRKMKLKVLTKLAI